MATVVNNIQENSALFMANSVRNGTAAKNVNLVTQDDDTDDKLFVGAKNVQN